VERVRSQGLVERADSSLQPAGGRPVEVHLSAALLTEDDQERIGITLYPATPEASEAPAAPELAGWLGTAPLAELLHRASALAEQQLIALALERSGQDETAAARVLGVSLSELVERRRDASLLPGTPTRGG
jgi:DNA-binding NtrC family response regulator